MDTQNKQTNNTEEQESFTMELIRDSNRVKNRLITILIVVVTLLFVVIGSIIGGIVYILTNYDLSFGVSTVQDSQGNNYNVVNSGGVDFGAESSSSLP